MKGKEIDKKTDEIIQSKRLMRATLQRVFLISYPKADRIINNLLEQGIIEKENDNYKILSLDKFKSTLKKLLK